MKIAHISRLAVVTVGALIIFPFTYIGSGFLPAVPLPRSVLALIIGVPIMLTGMALFEIVYRWVNSSVAADAMLLHTNADKTVILSQVESRIAAGDAKGATEMFDALIAANGLDDRLCRTAIDFYLGKLDASPARGEDLLRRMRNEQPQKFERYATQRLIDLYMSSVETYPKALTELRRLSERFPGTPEAAGAVAAIERIRAAQ